jgi:hypothetical protein
VSKVYLDPALAARGRSGSSGSCIFQRPAQPLQTGDLQIYRPVTNYLQLVVHKIILRVRSIQINFDSETRPSRTDLLSSLSLS